MDIICIKKRLFSIQNEGQWNKGLSFICNSFSDEPSIETGCLIVSEMYWLIKNRWYFTLNDDKQPSGFDQIDWSFEKHLANWLKTLLNSYDDAFMYWFLYFMLSIDFSPFLYSISSVSLQHIYDTLAEKLSRQSCNSTLHNLIVLTAGNNVEIGSTINFEKIASDIDSLHLQDNFADREIKSELHNLVRYKWSLKTCRG